MLFSSICAPYLMVIWPSDAPRCALSDSGLRIALGSHLTSFRMMFKSIFFYALNCIFSQWSMSFSAISKPFLMATGPFDASRCPLSESGLRIFLWGHLISFQCDFVANNYFCQNCFAWSYTFSSSKGIARPWDPSEDLKYTLESDICKFGEKLQLGSREPRPSTPKVEHICPRAPPHGIPQRPRSSLRAEHQGASSALRVIERKYTPKSCF